MVVLPFLKNKHGLFHDFSLVLRNSCVFCGGDVFRDISKSINNNNTNTTTNNDNLFISS